MPSINEMTIMGHVGQSPKLMANGKLLQLSVACSERYQDKATNEWKETTTWVPVKWWLSKGTEVVVDSIQKGQLVTVIGSYRSESYEKNGEKKSFTFCKARMVVPCSWPKADQSSPSTATQTTVGDYSDADYGDTQGAGSGDESYPF
jgi:single-stranded DNA-binding protein